MSCYNSDWYVYISLVMQDGVKIAIYWAKAGERIVRFGMISERLITDDRDDRAKVECWYRLRG